MTKEKYLEKLRSKLSILEESEIEDIIEEYSGYIDEKIKNGKSEKEALKDFGDVDDLAKELLSAYKINQNYAEKNNLEKIMDKINEILDGFVNYFSTKSFWDIIKIVIEIIVIGLLISLLRIPVEIMETIFNGLFNALPYPINEVLTDVFDVLIELALLLISIILFVKIIEKRYFQEVKRTKKVKSKKPTKVLKEEKKEETVTVKEKKGFIDTVSAIIVILIKFMLAVILIPILIGIVISIVGLVLDIYLISKGIFYLGILLCVIACLVGSITLSEAMIKFISNKKIKTIRFLVTLFASIGLLAGGVVITALELTSANYYDKIPEGLEPTQVTYKFERNEVEEIISNYRVNYVVDDSLDDINVLITYYDEFNELKVENRNKELIVFTNLIYQGKYLSEIILDDLKTKNFHNYNLLFGYEMVVSANAETINALKNSSQITDVLSTSYWYEDYEDLYRNDSDYLDEMKSGKEAVDSIANYLKIKVSEIEDIRVELELEDDVSSYIVSFEYDEREIFYKFIVDAKTGDIISQLK